MPESRVSSTLRGSRRKVLWSLAYSPPPPCALKPLVAGVFRVLLSFFRIIFFMFAASFVLVVNFFGFLPGWGPVFGKIMVNVCCCQAVPDLLCFFGFCRRWSFMTVFSAGKILKYSTSTLPCMLPASATRGAASSG